uniref:VRR-NUC domain-containing protein n=1 Tax=viral metagenome TaxID=1070528 RepID=A0A6M3LF70_9ZZZZ
MNESELLSNCLEYLQILRNQGKAWYMRVNSGMAFFGSGKKKYAIRLAQEGTADILIIQWYEPEGAPNKGETIVTWVETKADKGVQSPEQVAFQKEVEGFGCRYEIVRDLDELITITEG